MHKILIANRGEIALRVMRSCKEMGIKTVAIYSEADRNAPFVKYADEAVCVGPPPSNQSYLMGDKIIKICEDLNVNGIHPGYGFLSENADFARRVTKAGLTFIGPSPEAIETMGSKLAAKVAVSQYHIPMVPGTDKAIDDVKEAKQAARQIGFPILIKASAGGGGKGMRIVEKEDEFEEQMKRAVSEALAAFGDGSVFIEKYISSPRHIEFQILADTYGNIIHLNERECSIQRRHQKVIEESPSAIVTSEIRAAMGKCAVDVAHSCNYVGAGTVEFLMDEKKIFYFLEMNTRLQVEHPVTEFISGIDLVKEQIKIARGEKLTIQQNDIKINGHAIEARIYAEDPANNFLPNVGKLTTYNIPQGLGVRVDDGFEEGMDIPIYYDPMISKLIVHGTNRKEAIKKMIRAIDDYHISGVLTTLDFCKFVMKHPAYIEGNYNTHFVEKYFKPNELYVHSKNEAEIAALMATKLFSEKKQNISTSNNVTNKKSKWRTNRLAQ